MPETGQGDEPADAARTVDGAQWFVYYRVAEADLAQALGVVRTFQQSLQGPQEPSTVHPREPSPGQGSDASMQASAVPSQDRAASHESRWTPLHCGLMRRPGSTDGLVTVMETYRAPGGSVEPLRACLAAGPEALQPWLQGPRHVEEFVPCA